MGSLSLVQGTLGTALLCLIVFLGETGIPLPLLPGDVVLILGGVGIAEARLDPWIYLPLMAASVIGGALCGYAASRRLGRGALTALARALRVDRHLDRAARGLQDRGTRGLLVGRLVPGLRVLTTLVAGSLQVPVRPVLAAVLPTAVAWIGVMTLLGALIGPRVEGALVEVDDIAVAVPLLAAAIALASLPIRRAVRQHAAAPVPPAALQRRAEVTVQARSNLTRSSS